MSQTAIQIYKDQYLQLIQYRMHLIEEIEKTNNQITKIIKEAKAEKIDVVRLTQAS